MPNRPQRPHRRTWKVRLALLATSWGICELALWLFVGLPHPYAVDTHARDRAVGMQLQGVPDNRYLPSYHLPVALTLQLDGEALPGVAGETRFTIGPFGFRSPRLASIDKPAQARRIFCIGGSTTECLYLDDADAWPEVLQRELADCEGLDVVNAGHSGDATRDHVALLTQRVVAFEPDVVLVLAGINDLFQQMAADYSPIRADARARPRMQPHETGGVKSAVCDLSQVARAVVHLARRLGQADGSRLEVDTTGGWIERERHKWRALPWAEQPPLTAPMPEFEQNLRTIVATCRAHGATPVLATQPTIWGCTSPDCERLLWRRPPDDRRVRHEVLWQVLERFNDVTRRVAADCAVPLADLARELPKDVALFYDDDHFNVAGARAVGALLAAALRRSPEVQQKLGS